jgi:energy-coupling factor transporter transmembrane protein EcfT
MVMVAIAITLLLFVGHHQHFIFLLSSLGQLEPNFAGMMFVRSSTEVAHYADQAMSERLHTCTSLYRLYIYYNSKQWLDSLKWRFV